MNKYYWIFHFSPAHFFLPADAFTSRQASPLESFQIKMTKQISFQDIYSRIIIFFDQTLCCPSIPILVSVKHPMSNTRFKSMQNDLHTSLLHGQLSRLETGGGEVVGGLLFCWGFFGPKVQHTLWRSRPTLLLPWDWKEMKNQRARVLKEQMVVFLRLQK